MDDATLELYHKYIYDIYKSLPNKKNPNNYELAKIFEYFCCIKLSKKYKQMFHHYDEIKPSVKMKHQLPEKDMGIDASNLIDILAQFKLRTGSLSWRECSTFFSSVLSYDIVKKELSTKWKKCIIARNSDSKLSKNLKEKSSLFTDIKYERDDAIDYCKELMKNPPEIEEPDEKIELRNYQKECIKLIKNNDENIIISLPTGTGKNLIIINCLKSDCKYLILVPRIILMEQFNRELIKHKSEFKNNVQMIGDNNDVFDKDIDITICVYNSVGIVEKYAKTFDKIFIDEAHHIRAPQIYEQDDDEDSSNENNSDKESSDEKSNYEESNDEESSDEEDKIKTLLKKLFIKKNIDEQISDEESSDNESSDEEINNAKIETVLKKLMKNTDEKTSDEKSSDEKSSDDESSDDESSDEEINDTEDEIKKSTNYTNIIESFTKYNNNVYLSATIDENKNFMYYKKDIREMINNKYLCDYVIHVPIFNKDPSNRNICEHLLQRYTNVIIYCNSQKEGQKFNKLMNEVRENSCEYVDCHTPKKKRNDIIERYKSGDILFLVNVRVLCEGFDAPITKGVCFIHMPSSKTTLVQIIGRALRLHYLKSHAHIILPFSSDDDEKSINKFLSIMAQNDSVIKEAYEGRRVGDYISIEKMNEDYRNDEDDSDEEEEEKDGLEFKYDMIYDSLGVLKNDVDVWKAKLKFVKEYINSEHKRPSKRDKNKKIKQLGMWTSNQRNNYITKTKIMKNKEIYDEWSIFINDDKYKQYFISKEQLWKNSLKQVREYININNKRPSEVDKNDKIKKLGHWFSTQKSNYITKGKIMKNQDIYNEWTQFMNDNKYKKYFMSREERWNNNLQQIKKYINDNNIKPSQTDKNHEIQYLSHWIQTQKENYIIKNQIMKNKKIYDEWTQFINDNKYKKYFTNNKK